jgi:hypothetical protein
MSPAAVLSVPDVRLKSAPEPMAIALAVALDDVGRLAGYCVIQNKCTDEHDTEWVEMH